MRAILYLSFFIVSFPLVAESDLAYLILKSTVTNSEKQPTWICMERRGHCTHLPANKEMVSIAPGIYGLRHIDFMKSSSAQVGAGTQHFEDPEIFNFEAGKIYFIGNLKLQRKSVWKYELEVDEDPAQIVAACGVSPEIFEKYPLFDVKEGENLYVSCNAGNN